MPVAGSKRKRVVFQPKTRLAVVLPEEKDGFRICETSQTIYAGTNTFTGRFLTQTDPKDRSKWRLSTRQSEVKMSTVLGAVKMNQEKVVDADELEDAVKEARSGGMPRWEEEEEEGEVISRMAEKWRRRRNNNKRKVGELDVGVKKRRASRRINKGLQEEEEDKQEERAPRKRPMEEKAKGDSSNGTVEEEKKKATPPPKKARKTATKSPPTKRPPNWRLKPNEKVKETLWEKDPFFECEDVAKVDFVSPVVHSKLAIVAVQKRDLAMLKKLRDDRDRVHSLRVQKSVYVEMSALDYAFKMNNLDAVRVILAEDGEDVPERVEQPACRIASAGTGRYNPRSLGIQKIRPLNMSRGGREGNNALVKDYKPDHDHIDPEELCRNLFSWGCRREIINEAVLSNLFEQHQIPEAIVEAVSSGHTHVAAYYIERDLKHSALGSLFNRYHHESLTRGTQTWKDPIREVSAQKRGPLGMTPLHCACVNPNISSLKQLYAVCPNVSVADDNQRKLVHYAAACVGVEPLKFLVKYGANLQDVDDSGVTPLMIASENGRLENVKFIASVLKDKEDELGSNAKMGTAGVNRQSRDSWSALFLAVEEEHLDVVKYLIEELDANVERQRNTANGKMTILMVAAAVGNLEMVKYLSTKCNVTKHDRYKRTALTHACMNGSAAVAAYLLRMGSPVHKSDSSENTDLHYACAYGWHHCVLTLIEAGADLNAVNCWKLSPVAAGLRKGHTEIARYLLERPGVDINARDDDGRSILLSLICDANRQMPLSESLFEEIKDLVERRGADVSIADNHGKNALHYVCGYDFRPEELEVEEGKEEETAEVYAKRWRTALELRRKFVNFLVQKKCPLLARDELGKFPIQELMKNPLEDDTDRKDYPLLESLLKGMVKEINANKTFKIAKEDKDCTLLNTFCDSCSLEYGEEEAKIFELIVDFCKILKHRVEPGFDCVVEHLETVDGQQLSPLMTLCHHLTKERALDYKTAKNEKHHKLFFEGLQWDEETGNLTNLKDVWSKRTALILRFNLALHPKTHYSVDKIVYDVNSRENVTRKCHISALAILSHVPHEPKSVRGNAFNMMKSLTKDVGKILDLTDETGKTVLNRTVLSGTTEQVERLLNAGADVDSAYLSNSTMKVGKEENVFLKTCAIADAVERGDLAMVRLLLRHKADVTLKNCFVKDSNSIPRRRCLFTLATESCMRNRGNKDRMNILAALLEAGVKGDIKDAIKHRNALHLAVNATTDQADQALDLEMALIRARAGIADKDVRGRIPLHYAFVKIGRHQDRSRLDPIEICSMLVSQMSNSPDSNLNVRDTFGRTPLHYAAIRGATVCCLLLARRGADVNATDDDGNTALALAVAAKHEGCALALLQKGAKVDVMYHPPEDNVQPQTIDHNQFGYNHSGIFNPAPQHPQPVMDKQEPFSIFQGAVQNNWLGIAYLVLEQLEDLETGMTYATAVEVALKMKKLQFAKTLIARQVDQSKLCKRVSGGRSLLASLAKECGPGDSPGLQPDVFEMLLSAGITPEEADDSQSNAMHYACLNQNDILLDCLIKKSKMNVKVKNAFGLTPLAALFWNFQEIQIRRRNFEFCLEYLLDNGAEMDEIIPCKPLSYLQSGFSIDKKEFFETKDKSTPLIIALIHGDSKTVERLIQRGAYVNGTDAADFQLFGNLKGFGMTPLMHAVKANDFEMVIQLISEDGKMPRNEEVKDIKKDPSKFAENTKVNLDARDVLGRTVFHHLCQVSDPHTFSTNTVMTYDNVELLSFLLALEVDPSLEDKKGKTAFDYAVNAGAWKIAERLAGETGVDLPERPTNRPFWSGVMDGVWWERDFKYDVAKDAQAMLKKLEEQADKKRKKDKDEDDEIPIPNGCIVKDGVLHKDYAILMTKVDVSAGAWGLYNFYRMQIWKEQHKDLWILFTNWGRIGANDQGQYQNTPFPTAAAAEEEFEKIFRAKSGNLWHERDEFDPKPKKYRPVKLSHLRHVKKSEIEFDLKTDAAESKLPEAVRDLVAELADVNTYIDSYKELGGDLAAAPFGRIDRESVEEADKILEELKVLVDEKETLEEKRRRKALFDSAEEDKERKEEIGELLQGTLEEISSLSSDYFHLMPKGGFEYLRLSPIDSSASWKREKERVEHTLEMNVAERMLLGAMFRKRQMNPVDYIYRALGCKIQCLFENSPESDLIRQYMNNTRERNINVAAVFKVARPWDEEHFAGELRFPNKKGKKSDDVKEVPLNRRLLWHGSKASNLLGILHSGLRTSIPSHAAPVSGRSLGNGIYTADCFDKSFGFCFDWRTRHKRGSKFMLLCDVALGKSFEIKNAEDMSKLTKFPPTGRHSVVALGSQIPDPDKDVKVNHGEVVVPIGKLIAEGRYRIVGKSEFVTYSDSQTAVRYIVKIANA